MPASPAMNRKTMLAAGQVWVAGRKSRRILTMEAGAIVDGATARVENEKGLTKTLPQKTVLQWIYRNRAAISDV